MKILAAISMHIETASSNSKNIKTALKKKYKINKT